MHDEATQHTAGSGGAAVSAGRPELQVLALAVGLFAITALVVLVIPDLGDSIRDAGPWAFVMAALLFGLFEYTVFNVQFRREGISFTLSELPLAFALVFLSPPMALLARLPVAVPVLILARKNPAYKLAFNISAAIVDTAITILLFRSLLDAWDRSATAIIVSIVISLLAVAPVTSVFVSLAISRFEGGAVERILGEIRATWWMYTVNAALAAMTVALALIEPTLALLAVLPAAGVWYVLQSYGTLGQELRDLDAVHGFAGHVGGTLDVNEIGDTAVAEVVRLTRGGRSPRSVRSRRAGRACPRLRGRRAAPVGGRTGMERPPGRRRCGSSNPPNCAGSTSSSMRPCRV